MSSYLLYLETNGPLVINAIMPVAEVRVVNDTMQWFTVKSDKNGAELVAMMEACGLLKNYLIVQAGHFAYRGDGQLSGAARLLRD